MKTISNLLFAVIFIIAIGNGQWNNVRTAMTGTSGGSIPVGFGATFIDGEAFYLINITPEVAFGQLGVSLDLNLRFTTKGKLRTGDYNKFEDYLRVIRYVRWAQKGDPFYTRVGQLDYSLLGHGSIVYNYRNSASYDMRRTGIELDMNFDTFGFESMYSDIIDRGLLGMRGYVKPLKFTSFGKVPVINNFEVGVTYARDLSTVADITSADTSGRGLTIIGFDLGLPILSYSILKSTLYFDYAQIIHYGHGTSVGVNMNYSGLGLVDLRGKYELRFNGVHYMPAYFDALYEHERFDPVRRLSKSDMLDTVGANRGYYGELIISILNSFNIIAGYQAPFDSKNEGLLHAELRLPEVSGIVVRGAFDKAKIGRAFILDNYSLLSAEIGYKPAKYLLVSMLYQQTYSNRNPDGSFIKQIRVEPKVSLVFDF